MMTFKTLKPTIAALTMIFVSLLITSCSWVDGESVNLTIKLDPEKALNKQGPNGLDKANWQRVVLTVHGMHGNSDEPVRLGFTREHSSDDEIRYTLHVQVGREISVDADIYQENDVLIGYGSSNRITVQRGNNLVEITMDYSIEVKLNLAGGRFPNTLYRK